MEDLDSSLIDLIVRWRSLFVHCLLGMNGWIKGLCVRMCVCAGASPGRRRMLPACWSGAMRRMPAQLISTRPLVSALIVLRGPGAVVEADGIFRSVPAAASTGRCINVRLSHLLFVVDFAFL